MINPTVLQQIQHASVSERLQLVEFIIASLKGELATLTTKKAKSYRRFVAQTYSLGQDIQVDRDHLYAERG